jgi:UDP-glucose 4-epimerase
MLRWFDEIHHLTSVALRYFNASGADPDGRLGEEHDPETHLIPLLFRAVQTGKPVTIFGDDYPTPDGTCIRDYIHISDLAQAHILALAPDKHGFFNLGNGDGYSVRQVIQTCEKVTGKRIPAQEKPRRAGDPPRLVASAQKAFQELGWKPRFPKLEEIVSSAWEWHTRHPGGYPD